MIDERRIGILGPSAIYQPPSPGTVPRSAYTLARDVAICLALTGLLTVLLAAELVHRAQMSWGEALLITAPDSLPWALGAPLLFLLAERLPIEGPRWFVALLAHLALGCVIVGIIGFIRPPGPNRPPGPPPPRFAPGQPGPMPPPGGADRPPDFGPRPPRPRPDGPGGFRGHPPGPGRGEGRRPLDWLFRRGLQLHLPILLVVLLAAHARYFQRRSRERERHARELAVHLAQARLEALRMQLQPHFLFNALNGIAALIHEDPERADEMTTALAAFLRHTLHGAARDEVPLIEEIEYTKSYLAIEQARFGDRLHCEIDAPPETYGALVPMLLLQPLIENVVRHGVTLSSGAVRVKVRAAREGNRLRLAIHDNGPGPETGASEGIGLANTRARLKELHGEAASLTIRAEGGCVVEITLPFRLE